MQFCIYVLAACGLNNLHELLKDKVYNKRIVFGLVLLICLIFTNSFIKPDLYQSNRYGIGDSQKENIFNNIKNQYSYVINNSDLNKDGTYDDIDKNIFKQWTDSEAKLLNSQLMFQQSGQTKNELIFILESVNDSTDNLLKSLRRDHFYIITMLLAFLLMTFLYGKYTAIKNWHYICYIENLCI